MFSKNYPAAWIFHKNTCRSELNTLLPQEFQSVEDNYKEYLDVQSLKLPEIKIPPVTFSDLLFHRYSCRRFKNIHLNLQQVANVLFAGYGMNRLVMLGDNEFKERTVPSGGGLYPLELYMLVIRVEGLEPGIYHYVATPALLEQVKNIQFPRFLLENLFMQQPYVADAAIIIVATSVLERTMKKYLDRGYRYILYEAGHSFQNMNLMATACGLGSLNLGGFFDMDMCNIVGLDMEVEVPLYAMAVGVPEGTTISARMPEF